MIVNGFVIFLLGNLLLVEHFIKAVDLSLPVILWIVDRVIGIRHLSNRSYNGTFGNVKLIDRLSEICFGCSLNAVTTLTEIDRVEISLQYLILVKILFKVQRRKNLVIFTDVGYLIVARNVLDKLLSYRRTALVVLLNENADGTNPVNTVVVIESLILKGNESVLHLLGNLVEIDPDTVFLTVQTQNLDLLSIGVLGIEERGLVLIVPCTLKIDNGIACHNRDCVDKNIAQAYHECKTEYSEQRDKESACIR